MSYIKLIRIKNPYFGYEEVAAFLRIKPASAKVACARLAKNGILIRVKRNIYILKSRWDSMSRQDKFVLANLIQTPSYISLMTALDYYEITTQIQRGFIESVAIFRTKEVEIQGDVFSYTRISRELYSGFVKERGFFIATPEKAFLDAVYLTSLKRYKFDLSSIDAAKLNIPSLKRLAKKYPQRTQKLLENYGYFKRA